MIVLLSCSTSWCQNEISSTDSLSSTGELTNNSDSILIAINDLRKANAKMVELKYEKVINDSLRSIIIKDDEIINLYNNQVATLKKQVVQRRRERNIAGGIGLGAALLMAVLLLVK